jgi:hypothetical protein
VSFPLPKPEPDTITKRRMRAAEARSALAYYGRWKAMGEPDWDRLAQLLRVYRLIRRLAQLEGFVDMESLEVVMSGPPGTIPVPPR